MRALLALCLLAAPVVPAFAQAPDPVAAASAAFKAERAEAAKTFSKEELAAADELFAKAETATKAGNPKTALRLVGEARWQVPFVPAGGPAHVLRVLGVGRMRHGDRINAVAYSPDGGRVASASRDGTVRVWNAGNGRELVAYRGHADGRPPVDPDPKEKSNVLVVAGVAFSSDGEWVASSGGLETHVWEAKTGKRVALLKAVPKPADPPKEPLKVPAGNFKSLAFFKDRNRLLTGGDDGRLAVWDVAKGKPVFLSDDLPMPANAVAVAPNEKFFGMVTSGGQLVVMAAGAEPRLAMAPLGVSDSSNTVQVQALAFTPNGAGVFTGGNDKKVKLIAGPEGLPGLPGGPNVPAGGAVRRFEGHTDTVNAIAVSADGKFLVTGSEDKTVMVWDAATGRILRVFQGHLKEVTCVAVRPDGGQIASAGEDGSIRLWTLAPADDHREMAEAGDNLWAVAYAPDGKTFAAAGADRTVRVYDTATGKLLKALPGHKGAVTALAFLTPNRLASASGDKTVKVWDVAAGTAVDCAGHTSAVLCVALGGDRIVSGGTDKTVRGWDPADGKSSFTWAGRSAVCAVAARKDGNRVAVGCANGELVILDVAGGEVKVVGEKPAHAAGVASVAWASDGERLATAGGDGVVRLWAVTAAGMPMQTTNFDAAKANAKGITGASPVTAVAFSADDRYLVGGGAEGVVRAWDVATGGETRVLRGHGGWVTAVAYAPDGKTVLSCSVDRTARLFDLPRADGAGAGHAGKASCIAVSRDGRFAATGSDDKTVKVWDLTTGREVATLAGHDKTVTAVAFILSGKVAAGAIGGRLLVWDAATGRETFHLTGDETAISMAVSADGKKFGVAWSKGHSTDDQVEGGFSVFPGLENAPEKLQGGRIRATAISPDAGWGATGDKDGIIRIWDLARKERLKDDWPIVKGKIADIGFTPDRKFVLVIDDDGQVKVADVAKREVVAGVKALADGVSGLTVSPVGDKFATLGAGGTVRVWDMKCKELRSWQLPFAANAAVFTIDGKKLLTANADGTAFVLEVPD